MIQLNNQQIIAYASKALSDTEKRYSQTEKEPLAIVCGQLSIAIYFLGSEFTLVTDYKPLAFTFQPYRGSQVTCSPKEEHCEPT